MITVGKNLGALDAARNVSSTQSRLVKTEAKLSSGLKINSAADDPAGLVISEQMRAQIGSLQQQIDNADLSINKYQTAGHAVSQLQDTVTQLRSLAVAAANEGYNDEAVSAAYQTAANNLIQSFNASVDTAQFGTQKLLNGDESSVADIEKLSGIDMSTPQAAQGAVAKIDQAAEQLGQAQGDIGAKVAYDLESTRSSLQVALQNTTAAESTLRDTDYAAETAKLVRDQLLQQTGVAILVHANQSVKSVLGLLNA